MVMIISDTVFNIHVPTKYEYGSSVWLVKASQPKSTAF